MSNRYYLLLPSMWIGLPFFPRIGLEHHFSGQLRDIMVWADAEVCPGRSKPFAVDHGAGGSGGCFPASHNELDIRSSTTGPLEDCKTLRHNLAHKPPRPMLTVQSIIYLYITVVRRRLDIKTLADLKRTEMLLQQKDRSTGIFARISIQIDESNWVV